VDQRGQLAPHGNQDSRMVPDSLFADSRDTKLARPVTCTHGVLYTS
jgi:hypothetical protein